MVRVGQYIGGTSREGGSAKGLVHEENTRSRKEKARGEARAGNGVAGERWRKIERGGEEAACGGARGGGNIAGRREREGCHDDRGGVAQTFACRPVN